MANKLLRVSGHFAKALRAEAALKSSQAPAPDSFNQEQKRRRCALRLIEARRLRSKFVSAQIFDEPGWQILLTAYLREASGASFVVAELEEVTAVPHTTAARWLSVLVEEKLVSTSRGHSDIELTDLGRDALNRYFDEVAKLDAMMR